MGKRKCQKQKQGKMKNYQLKSIQKCIYNLKLNKKYCLLFVVIFLFFLFKIFEVSYNIVVQFTYIIISYYCLY